MIKMTVMTRKIIKKRREKKLREEIYEDGEEMQKLNRLREREAQVEN